MSGSGRGLAMRKAATGDKMLNLGGGSGLAEPKAYSELYTSPYGAHLQPPAHRRIFSCGWQSQNPQKGATVTTSRVRTPAP